MNRTIPYLVALAIVIAFIGGAKTAIDAKDVARNNRVKEINANVSSGIELAKVVVASRGGALQSVTSEFEPAGAIRGKLLDEIITRCSAEDRQKLTKYNNDLATKCHEGSHFVNNRIRNQVGWEQNNAFYIGGGCAVVLPEPRITIRQVAALVDQSHRDRIYYDLYLVKQANGWLEKPLYLLDEWSASINGLQAARELGVGDTGDGLMSKQFRHYADCLVRAIEKHDPTYSAMKELKAFIAFQKERVKALCD